ncbi:MAG: tetratricopeptide repeat protein [Anaerolineae bacterium]|nr:tetratricopeptide repeat protein [Anaerolineae bacterium]
MKRVMAIATPILLGLAIMLLMAGQTLLAKTSTTAGSTMAVANQLYQTGQYNQAAQAYQQLVDQGYANSALFYNLGQAYYKQGDLGQALVNYRRAEQLAPGDAAIETNLAQVRADVTGGEVAAPAPGLMAQLAHLTQSWLSINQLALAALGFWIVFCLLVIVSSNSQGALRRKLIYGTSAAALAVVLSLAGLGSRLLAMPHDEAVIVANEVTVSGGPGPQYAADFTLADGTEVKLIETRGRWLEISVPQTGQQGWVPSEAVETIRVG